MPPVSLPPKPPKKARAPRKPKPEPVALTAPELPSGEADAPDWSAPEPDPTPVEGHSSGETAPIESSDDAAGLVDRNDTR